MMLVSLILTMTTATNWCYTLTEWHQRKTSNFAVRHLTYVLNWFLHKEAWIVWVELPFHTIKESIDHMHSSFFSRNVFTKQRIDDFQEFNVLQLIHQTSSYQRVYNDRLYFLLAFGIDWFFTSFAPPLFRMSFTLELVPNLNFETFPFENKFDLLLNVNFLWFDLSIC